MSFHFPKRVRLLRQRDFRRVCHKGKSKVGNYIIIDYYLGKSSTPKLGLSVSRRYGKANKRNRFKRVIREVYRHLYSDLPKNLEINVRPRPEQNPLGAAREFKNILIDFSSRRDLQMQ